MERAWIPLKFKCSDEYPNYIEESHIYIKSSQNILFCSCFPDSEIRPIISINNHLPFNCPKFTSFRLQGTMLIFTSTNWNHYWTRDHFILFQVYSNDSILLNYSIISQLGNWHLKKSTNYIQISPVLLVFICVCVWHSIQYYHLCRFTWLPQFL